MVGPSPAAHSYTSTIVFKVNYPTVLYEYDIASLFCEINYYSLQPVSNYNPTQPYIPGIDLLYTGTHMRPSSYYYAKSILPKTQPKQTNPQPNPNTTLLRIIIVNIYRATQEVRSSRWVLKTWNRFFKAVKKLPRAFYFVFLLIIWIKNILRILFFLSRCHTLSNTYLVHFTGRKHALPKTPSHPNNMYYASAVYLRRRLTFKAFFLEDWLIN